MPGRDYFWSLIFAACAVVAILFDAKAAAVLDALMVVISCANGICSTINSARPTSSDS